VEATIRKRREKRRKRDSPAPSPILSFLGVKEKKIGKRQDQGPKKGEKKSVTHPSTFSREATEEGRREEGRTLSS